MTPRDRPVLIVDDDVDIREALSDLLEDRGFQVMTAANGIEALNVLRGMEPRPSVILLDLMMPMMDGYGFLEERKADPVLTAIPVAIITAGHGVDRDRLGSAAPIIPKPIDVSHLIRVIQGFGGGDGGSPA